MEFTSDVRTELVEFLAMELYLDAHEVEKEACKYLDMKKYYLSHVSLDCVMGFNMLTFLVKTKSSKGTLKQGYQLASVYNLDCPDCSELGDVYITKNTDGTFSRSV